MAWYDVTIKGRLTAGENKSLTPAQFDWRQDAVDRLVGELNASCIAEPEMVARVRSGQVEIVGKVEGKGRAEALDKVMRWEMSVEDRMDIDLFCDVSRDAH